MDDDEPIQRIRVPIYEPTMDVERIPVFDTKMAPHEASAYKLGGYRPTHLSELLVDRYRIVHKLGHGDEATVWLAALEPEIENCPMRYVALKIFRADLSGANGGEANNELAILSYLKEPWTCEYRDHAGVEMKHPGECRVTRLFSSFETISPNGTHLVLVMPFRGFCLRDIKGLLEEKKLSINKQLAWGLAYLHKRFVCHGDLTATNVVLGMDLLQHCDTPNLYVHVGAPEKTPFEVAIIQRKDNRKTSEGPSDSQDNTDRVSSGSNENADHGVGDISGDKSHPDYIVTAIDVSKLKPILFGDSVTIIDFGRAFKFGSDIQPVVRPEIPIFYPAPESVFDHVITEKLDIWYLACLMWQVRTEEVLFQGPHFGGFKKGRDEKDAVLQWGDILKLPTASYYRGRNLPWELKKQHHLNDRCGPPAAGLFTLMYRSPCVMTGPEMDSFQKLLSGMLRYNPEHRWGAEQVISHEYCTELVKL